MCTKWICPIFAPCQSTRYFLCHPIPQTLKKKYQLKPSKKFKHSVVIFKGKGIFFSIWKGMYLKYN